MKARDFLGQGKNWLFDLIFPKFCVGCGQEGVWLCSSCLKKILPVATQVCPTCGRIAKYGNYCSKDYRAWGAAGIIAACYWQEGPIKELIHNFKYNSLLEVKVILGDLLVKALKDNLPENQNFLITAAPLHFWRRSQRGYNQSELLADYVAEKLKLPKNFKILRKIRSTKPQVKFSGKKRRENLKNSFVFNNNFNIQRRTIIIVDDVTTTGTTIFECAKVLRKAGARKVWGLVVAKG